MLAAEKGSRFLPRLFVYLVIRCGELDAPANGAVGCSKPDDLDLTDDQSDMYGSSCSFTCNVSHPPGDSINTRCLVKLA